MAVAPMTSLVQYRPDLVQSLATQQTARTSIPMTNLLSRFSSVPQDAQVVPYDLASREAGQMAQEDVQWQEEPSWWGKQSTGTKVAVVGGGLVLLGAIVFLATSGSGKGYKPNLRRKGKGKIRTLKGGKRFGHHIPPKRYRRKGAKLPSDYAWPEGFKYPLIFRHSDGTINIKQTVKHIRSAKGYFTRHKHRYPPKVRQTIARRINQASDRFHAGSTRMSA